MSKPMPRYLLHIVRLDEMSSRRIGGFLSEDEILSDNVKLGLLVKRLIEGADTMTPDGSTVLNNGDIVRGEYKIT